jgi:hypothetical protein
MLRLRSYHSRRSVDKQQKYATLYFRTGLSDKTNRRSGFHAGEGQKKRNRRVAKIRLTPPGVGRFVTV